MSGRRLVRRLSMDAWGCLNWLVGWLGVGLVGSLRIRILGLEHYLDFRERGQPVVFAAWHENLALVFRHGGRYRVAVLIASGRDGDLGAALAERLGVVVVRGDRRQPLGTLRTLGRLLGRGQDLCLFADGPLGPARRARPGALKLARTTGSPLLPVAAVASPCWRLGSWDRLRLPWPGARVVVVVGEALPAGADEALLAARLAALEQGAWRILRK